MSTHKRLLDKFPWIPLEKRPGRIPGPPPMSRKPETRRPLYFLKFDNDELFFVNLTDETLSRVSTESDSKMKDFMNEEQYLDMGGPSFRYDFVKPQEAVRIDKYDQFLDPESIIYVNITVSKPNYDEIVFRIGGKGGVNKDMVLLWDNGDSNRRVRVFR